MKQSPRSYISPEITFATQEQKAFKLHKDKVARIKRESRVPNSIKLKALTDSISLEDTVSTNVGSLSKRVVTRAIGTAPA